MKQHPPKPSLALTIGITGHRSRRDRNPADTASPETEFDADKIKAGIDQFLETLKGAIADLRAQANDWFDPGPAAITLVSSLAEGADRIAAKSALSAGMSVDVVLPCARPIYEQTFADDDSRREFSVLLDEARACLILPTPFAGGTPDLTRAYETVGLTVLAQADILLSVWDGKPARGRGGTGDIVDDAARQGVPIVVVDPVNGAARLLGSGGEQFPLPVRRADELPSAEPSKHALVETLRAIILPSDSAFERAGLETFLATRLAKTDELPKKLAANLKAWAPPAASVANRTATSHVFAAFAAAERIAQQNAGAFRRAFAFNFGAGAVAAGCIAVAIVQDYRAALSGPASTAMKRLDWHPWFVLLELGFVTAVGVVAYLAVRRQWHHRWLEARELAERLRIAWIFWMLGAWPRNLTSAQRSWPGWYARAVTRAQPLFSADLGAVLPDARAALAALVEDQWRYHCKNVVFCETVDRLLDWSSKACLLLTILNSVLFLVGHWKLSWISWTGWNEMAAKPYSLGLAVFLPAAAAAFYGIRLFGDFEDIVRRSNRTGEALFSLRELLEKDPGDLLVLRARAGQAAAAMLSDLAAWRVAVESRSLAAT